MHVAIYARASKDREEKRISVDRQVARCGKLAADLFPGATVVSYVDNDLSGANPDVQRPGYDRLLEAVRRGEVAELVCHEQSRLTRQPGQWDALVVTLTRAGITKVHTVQGGVVPVEPGNRLTGRIMAVVDAEEAERAKARTLAAHAQLAAEGRPNGGRAYGYHRTRDAAGRSVLEIDPEQAAVVRRICDQIVVGHATSAIVAQLNSSGVVTPQGGTKWRNNSVRSVASKPAIAGLRAHNGEIVGPARWEPIIDPDRWRKVQRALGSATVIGLDGKVRRAPRAHRSPGRRWLLTGGIAVCGRCGSPLRIGRQPRRDGNHLAAYQCHVTSGPDACVALSISPAELVEELVSGAVLAALDNPKMAARLANRPDEVRDRLLADLHGAEDRIADAAQMYGSGEIDVDTFRVMHGPAKARADGIRAQLAAIADPDVDLPAADQLRGRWKELSLRARQQVIERLVEKVVVLPGPPGGARWLDPVDRVSNRLEIHWRR